MSIPKTPNRYCSICGMLYPSASIYSSGECPACHKSKCVKDGKRFRITNGMRKVKSGVNKGKYKSTGREN